MVLIELAYQRVEGHVEIRAQVGGETSDVLATHPVPDGMTDAQAAIHAVEFLFAGDDSTWNELQALEQEFRQHTHGQPD